MSFGALFLIGVAIFFGAVYLCTWASTMGLSPRQHVAPFFWREAAQALLEAAPGGNFRAAHP